MSRVVRASRFVLAAGLAATVAACSPGAAVPTDSPSPIPTSATDQPTEVPPPTPTAAPVVGAGEPWIAFQQFLGKSTVMLVRPDGSGLHSPTVDVGGGDQTNPDWSPDGSRLVFAVADGGHETLWVVNADGTGARLLADCEGDCSNLDDPDWSPDGRTVLFSRNSKGPGGTALSTLEQVDVASGATSVIVQAAPAHFYAGQRWSPDGKSVVLEVVTLKGPNVGDEIDDVSLAIIDVAAPTPAGRELIGSHRFPETAAWAPDGTEIVFGAKEAPDTDGLELFAIRPDGSGLRQITHVVRQGGYASTPDVTADSSFVIFSEHLPDADRWVLGRVHLDGGEIGPATGAEYIDGVHPRLRPVP